MSRTEEEVISTTPRPGLKIPDMRSPIPFSSLKLYQSNKTPALTMQTRVRLMVEQQQRRTLEP